MICAQCGRLKNEELIAITENEEVELESRRSQFRKCLVRAGKKKKGQIEKRGNPRIGPMNRNWPKLKWRMLEQ